MLKNRLAVKFFALKVLQSKYFHTFTQIKNDLRMM